MVAPVHNFDSQIIAGRISEAAMGWARGSWTYQKQAEKGPQKIIKETLSGDEYFDLGLIK
jgi:hypothetical protein